MDILSLPEVVAVVLEDQVVEELHHLVVMLVIGKQEVMYLE